MINTEYIRSLNANYERMALGEKPEEKIEKESNIRRNSGVALFFIKSNFVYPNFLCVPSDSSVTLCNVVFTTGTC